VALTNLMRLSLLKAAHAVMSGAAYRKSGSPHLLQPMYAKVREHGAPRPGGKPGEEERDLSHNQRVEADLPFLKLLH
jgi:hypothetical protein